MNQYITVNGKRVIKSADMETVDQLPKQPGDAVMRKTSSGFEQVAPNAKVEPGETYTTVPSVTKGAEPAMSVWVRRDLDQLQQMLGNKLPVSIKGISRDGHAYIAVQIENVRLNQQKFNGRTYGKMLFLLPSQYPAVPPIGLYVNYPFEMSEADHHFHRRTYYGAPDLQQQGWYWYCLQPLQANTWLPKANPEDGHNLTSLFAAASHAFNS